MEKEIHKYEEFTIIDILPTQTYYSRELKCNRISQMIGVMDDKGNKMNVKLYPPFSQNSFEPGDRVRLWLEKRCCEKIKKANIEIPYYKAKTCEPVKTSSPIPYATWQQIQALTNGTISYADIAEQYNKWQTVNMRQNNYVVQIKQQIIDHLQEQLTNQTTNQHEVTNQPTQSTQHEVINTKCPTQSTQHEVAKLPQNENYFTDKYNIIKIITESL